MAFNNIPESKNDKRSVSKDISNVDWIGMNICWYTTVITYVLLLGSLFLSTFSSINIIKDHKSYMICALIMFFSILGVIFFYRRIKNDMSAVGALD